MKRYTVLMIRDYPDFAGGVWHSYPLGRYWTFKGAFNAAKKEVRQRGGKYGAVIYNQNREVDEIHKHDTR